MNSRFAWAGNIFEDDWTPPVPRKVTPAPPIEVPAVTPVPTPAGAPASTHPPVPKPMPPLAAARRPVPERAEQARSRKLFREVFAKELADRSPGARRALAGRLIDEARKASAIPSDQFVLLFGATEAARDGSDLSECVRAVDTMTEAFDVDGLQLKVDTALKMSIKADSPLTTSQNVWAGMMLLDQLIAADDYSPVARLSALMRPAVEADPSQSVQLQNRIREADARRMGADRITKDLERLKVAPDDATANLAVGKFLCFTKADWTRGLPLLAKGTDVTLQALAKKELANPTDPGEKAALGDGWWDVANSQRDLAHAKIVEHAALFYAASLEGSSGLRRAAMEKRLAEAAVLSGRRVVNLMPLIDADRDQVNGTWRLANGELTSNKGGFVRLRIPYQPPAEYDFHVDFTRVGGDDTVVQELAHAGHDFAWLCGSGGTRYGFDVLAGQSIDRNKTVVQYTKPPGTSRRFSSLVKVRKNSVSAYVDGMLIVTLPTDYSDLKVYGKWFVGEGVLGVGTSQSTVFHVIEVVEVTGVGKQLPHRK